MTQGKVYRNSSNLTTPPAIQGPEVSATWRRTCRAEVLMTVRMPQDTVDSGVYVMCMLGSLPSSAGNSYRKKTNVT